MESDLAAVGGRGRVGSRPESEREGCFRAGRYSRKSSRERCWVARKFVRMRIYIYIYRRRLAGSNNKRRNWEGLNRGWFLLPSVLTSLLPAVYPRSSRFVTRMLFVGLWRVSCFVVLILVVPVSVSFALAVTTVTCSLEITNKYVIGALIIRAKISTERLVTGNEALDWAESRILVLFLNGRQIISFLQGKSNGREHAIVIEQRTTKLTDWQNRLSVKIMNRRAGIYYAVVAM